MSEPSGTRKPARMSEHAAQVTQRSRFRVSTTTVIVAIIFLLLLGITALINVGQFTMAGEAAADRAEHQHSHGATDEEAAPPEPPPDLEDLPKPPPPPPRSEVLAGLREKLYQGELGDRTLAVLSLRTEGEEGWKMLAEALSSPNEEIRFAAANGLAFVDYRPAADKLRGVALNDPSPLVRESAAYALGRIGGEQDVSVLRQALRDPESAVREGAALGLASMTSPAARDLMLATLEDADETVRGHAAEGLYRLSAREQTRDLITEPVVSAAVEKLNDPNAKVREDMVILIGNSGNKQAGLQLLRFLHYQGTTPTEKSWRVRARAAEAMGKLFPGQAKEYLQVVTALLLARQERIAQGVEGDLDPVVAYFAEESLREMGYIRGFSSRTPSPE